MISWRRWVQVGLTLLGAALWTTTAGAQALPADEPSETVWPNKESNANSDEWIRLHHDNIKQMKPRVLVLNYVNGLSKEEATRRVEAVMAAIRESSRYHGYKRPNAPAFLDYQLYKLVNLTDPELLPEDSRLDGNSSLYPRVPDWKEGLNFRYGELFSEKYAEHYGVSDPANPGKLLTLEQLVNRGVIHEIWFLAIAGRFGAPYVTTEVKQAYNAELRKIGSKSVQAGAAGSDEQPFVGRSLRIVWINSEAGPGCAMEHLGYGLEGLARSKAIPYFTHYFDEFTGNDLKKRYRLPFDSFDGREPGSEIKHPTETSLIYKYKGEEFTVPKFVSVGGSLRYNPAARREYDLDSPVIVQTAIEHYRLHDGIEGKDKVEPWSTQRYARYRQVAAGCQGPWLLYMRQNMPGLDNKARDDQDKPMKNWWPFLFY